MKKLIGIVSVLLGVTLSAWAQTPGPVLSEKWLYLSSNLREPDGLAETCALVKQAAQAGYNGVAFTYSMFLQSATESPAYLSRIRVVRDACRNANLKCIACVMPIGYANRILAKDPNLAEGLPVIDAPFVVKNNIIVPDDHSVQLQNQGFEDFYKNNDNFIPRGWQFVGAPGKTIFVDTDVKSHGKASLRMQNIRVYDKKEYAAVYQSFKVEPFRYYHVSLMVKTLNYQAADKIVIRVNGDGRTWLNYFQDPISPTQNWKQINITFNSLEFSNITLRLEALSPKSGKSGTIWWDDIKIEPAGLVNVVRRSGAPLRMTSENGKTVYVEGKDFQDAVDRRLGNFPWKGAFTVWHRPPIITLPKGSRLRDGQRVHLSYYHTAIIYRAQVMCCMNEPKLYDILDANLKKVKEELEPDGYFLQHDEIRVQGYDVSCNAKGKTPGQNLAENIAKCVQIVRKHDPEKPIYVWSDMFCPYQNARKSGRYYLVKGEGPWYESWKGLPEDVIIVNWRRDNPDRRNTMQFFSKLGHQQILAGYYDSNPWEIADWLRDGAGIPGINGVMYTTWKQNYRDMIDFLRYAEGKGPLEP